MKALMAGLMVLAATTAHADSLVVLPGQTIELAAGTYTYDSVTVHPLGFLRISGRVTLDVAGDVRVLAEEVQVVDPETGQPYTRIDKGTIASGLPARFGTSGLDGSNGFNGTNGYCTAPVCTIFTVQVASGGAWGGNAGDAVPDQFALDMAELVVNAGHDIVIDGDVELKTVFIAGHGGTGGAGGNGGLGLSHLGAPNEPGVDDRPLAREYANGGAGGRGGDGGDGARVAPPEESRVVFSAAHQFVLGLNGRLATSSGADGGWGRPGGHGGSGASGGQASLTFPLRYGDRGIGGEGGDGGDGAGGGRAGNIYIQAASIVLAGYFEQVGARGGDGGEGGVAGAPGASGEGGLCCWDGGDGGDGADGGRGGSVILRGMVISNTSTALRYGGFRGYGGAGGYPASFLYGNQGAPGADGFEGRWGGVVSVVVSPLAEAPLDNGSFDDGLAFFRRSGGGSASVVDLSGNAVIDLVTTETEPVTLAQLVSTSALAPTVLQLDYQLLSVTGGLEVRLGSAKLLDITAAGVDSSLGAPEVAPSPLAGFTRVTLVVGDPALRGVTADLTVRLRPGSIAHARVDNLSFASGPPAPPDADGDGFTVREGDCNDQDPTVHPGAAEVPNGADDDCDGLVDGGTPTDQTPPTTEASATPAANPNGWNNGEVTVLLLASDTDSGVQDIQYSLTGAQSGGTTVVGPTATVVVTAEGETTLTYFARDVAGNVEAAHTLVVRIDETPPALSCAASPALLWPPNHALVPVGVDVSIKDSLSGSSGFTLLSAASDEADAGLGAGDHPGDIRDFETGTADTSGMLRAERSGAGHGRTYSLGYGAIDAAGNAATCAVEVVVPHNR